MARGSGAHVNKHVDIVLAPWYREGHRQHDSRNVLLFESLCEHRKNITILLASAPEKRRTSRGPQTLSSYRVPVTVQRVQKWSGYRMKIVEEKEV